MALTDIQKVRLEVADNDPALPVLSDDEVSYFLEKNNNSIQRAAVDAAKTIMFKLSMNAGEQSVDIFTLRGKDAARAYIDALRLYITNPNLNGIFKNLNMYVGGTSKADMQANVDATDNNVVVTPSSLDTSYPSIIQNDWLNNG